MRKVGRFLIAVLDGTPATPMRQRGQSLVEMALITPILILLIAGIVEIGWYANNYMILLEVTRVGARAGTVLTGEFSPEQWWGAEASFAPLVLQDAATPATTPEGLALARNYRNCTVLDQYPGFYNFITCVMLQSMDPLTLHFDPAMETPLKKLVRDRAGDVVREVPYPDDIVISVFSLQAINNADPATALADLNAAIASGASQDEISRLTSVYQRTWDFGTSYPAGHQVIVVGRYPTNANECNADRDPFDYFTALPNNAQDVFTTADGRQYPVELVGWDAQVNEFQLGYSYTGQHRVSLDAATGELASDMENGPCWGSTFTSGEVERLMNLSQFPLDAPERAYLPGQGLVLVEMHWMHELLLRLPLLTPITRAFGDPDNIVISAWAAFPVPSVEPDLIYQLYE